MSQLIHVSDLVHQVTALYRKHFFDFLRLLLWLLVPTILADLLTIIPANESLKDVLGVALTIITIVASLWLSVMLVDLVRRFNGSSGDAKKLEKRSWGVWGRVIDFMLITLLQGLVVGIGFLLFIVPGVIFWGWFSFARYAVLVDGVSPGSQALRASRDLVIGRFWKVAWRWIGSYLYFGVFLFLVLSILFAVVGALTGNPAAAFQGMVTYSFENPGDQLWWTSLIMDIITILATPVFVAVGVMLYEDAKRSR